MKKIAILLALSMMLGIFSGCGSTPAGNTASPGNAESSATPEPTPEATPEQKPVELRTVSMFGGTDPSAADYQQLLKSFMDQNPGITISDESATSDETWKARVTTDFASGNDPDVLFYFTGTDAKQLIENKKVVSIEEIQSQYPDYAKDISDAAMGFMKEFDGKHYAVPVRGYYEGLFCNKDLFDKYSLALPTDWAALEAAVKKFSAEGVIPFAVSFSDVPHYFIEHLILAEGGVAEHSVNPKDTYPESWAKGLSYFKTLKDMGAFPADVNATKNDITTNLFYDKKAAMTIDGSWFIGGLKDPENTVVLPMPPAPGGKKDPTEIIGGFSSGFYISAAAWEDDAKRAAAANLVMHMTSKDAIAAFAKVAGSPAADVPAPADMSAVMKAGIEMGGKAKAIDSPVDSRLSKEAWTYFISQVGALADGEATPQQVLDEVVARNK